MLNLRTPAEEDATFRYCKDCGSSYASNAEHTCNPDAIVNFAASKFRGEFSPSTTVIRGQQCEWWRPFAAWQLTAQGRFAAWYAERTRP